MASSSGIEPATGKLQASEQGDLAGYVEPKTCSSLGHTATIFNSVMPPAQQRSSWRITTARFSRISFKPHLVKCVCRWRCGRPETSMSPCRPSRSNSPSPIPIYKVELASRYLSQIVHSTSRADKGLPQSRIILHLIDRISDEVTLLVRRSLCVGGSGGSPE